MLLKRTRHAHYRRRRWRTSVVQVAAASLALLAVARPAQAQVTSQAQPLSSISGVVRDAAGLPITDAVLAVGGEGQAQLVELRTRADGRFRFTRLPVGVVEVRARRIGFEPHSYLVEVTADEEAVLEVRLEPVAQRLDAVTVFEQREVYDARLEGFYARVSAKKAGHFITRARLDRSVSWTLPDILREIPGLRVAPLNGINKAVRLRGARCAPLVFVDGFPASAGEFDLEMLPIESLEGVEVYSGMASVPSEFGAARGLERCGVIAAWSRPATRPERRQRAVARVDVEALVNSGDVFTADQVQQEARLDTAQSPAASYPDELWRAGTGGRVLLELVVQPDGHVQPGSVRIISASHAEFADAARRALEDSFFSPAVLGRRAVHQLVQLPVVFVPGLEAVPELLHRLD